LLAKGDRLDTVEHPASAVSASAMAEPIRKVCAKELVDLMTFP